MKLKAIREELNEVNERLAGEIMAELDANGVGDLIRWYCRRAPDAVQVRLLGSGEAQALRRKSVDANPRAKGRAATKKRQKKSKPKRQKKPASNRQKRLAAPSLEWRRELLADVMKYEKRTEGRVAAMNAIADKEHTLPDGTTREISRGTLFVWLQKLERETA